jgi:hypothetical protein
MNDFTFKEQFYTFHNYGFANDPSTNSGLVTNSSMKDAIHNTSISLANIDADGAIKVNGSYPMTVYNSNNPKAEKKKRKPAGMHPSTTHTD